MTDRKREKTDNETERARRLAEALRANLRRRKDQARERREPGRGEDGDGPRRDGGE